MATKKVSPTPAPSMFANATVLPAAKVSKTTTTNREEITVPGIRKIAQLDAVVKAATAALKSTKDELEDFMLDHFLAKGGDKKPDSFNAIEDSAKANVQLKRKASNIALNEAEVKILREVGVEPIKEDTTIELLAINPAYASDQRLLSKIEKALKLIPDLPTDLIVKQAGVSRYVIDEAVCDKAWKTGDPEAIRVTTTLAFAPALAQVDAAQIGETIRELFEVPETKETTLDAVMNRLAEETTRVAAKRAEVNTRRIETAKTKRAALLKA